MLVHALVWADVRTFHAACLLSSSVHTHDAFVPYSAPIVACLILDCNFSIQLQLKLHCYFKRVWLFNPKLRLQDDVACTPHQPVSLPSPARLDLSYFNPTIGSTPTFCNLVRRSKTLYYNITFFNESNDNIDINQICHHVFARALCLRKRLALYRLQCIRPNLNR